MDIGVRYPAHSTALGKVLLAHLPQDQLLGLFDHFGLAKSSPKTIDSKDRLLSELDCIRKLGYAASDGELFLGIRAAAAPIFDESGHVAAAVSITGATVYIEDGNNISTVKLAAREISRRFGAAEQVKPPEV